MSDPVQVPRKSGRRPVALQVRLAFGDLNEFVERYATNLSDGGIFIRSRDPRPVGSRLSFELRLRGGELVFSGEGTVRWVQGLDSRGLGTPGMGLQFDALSDESRAILQRILDARETDDAPPPVEGAVPASWRPLEEFPPPPEPEPEQAPKEPAPPPMLTPGELAATPRDAGYAMPKGLAQAIQNARTATTFPPAVVPAVPSLVEPLVATPAAPVTDPPTIPPTVPPTVPPPAPVAPVDASAGLTAGMLAAGLGPTPDGDLAEDTAPPIVELPPSVVEMHLFDPAPSQSTLEASERTSPMFGKHAGGAAAVPPVIRPGVAPAPAGPPLMVPAGPPVMTPASRVGAPAVPPTMQPVAPPVGVPGAVGIARIGLVQARPAATDLPPVPGIRSARSVGPSLAIGVDVGWSTLRVAALTVSGSQAKHVPVGPAGVGVPALAAWDAGRLLVGAEAQAFAANGGWAVRGLLRLVGALPNSKAVQAWKRRQVVDVAEGPDGRAALCLGREVVPVALVARRLLSEVRVQAELATGAPVTQVSFALPAWFPLHQRRALRAVAEEAGLQVARIVASPVASYAGLHADAGKRRSLLVDWGDGGFSAGVVEQSQNVVELASVAVDSELGLIDMDLSLLGQLLEQFEKDSGLAVPEDMRIFERVLQAAGQARVALQDSLEHRVEVHDLVSAGLSKADLEVRLPRAKLAAIASPLLERAYELVRQALADRRFGGADLDEVVVLGGVTKTSLLARRLAEKLFKEPVRPDDARDLAALGAARLADGERSVGRFVVGGVAGATLGLQQGGQVRKVIDRQALLPVERTHVQSTTEHKQAEMELPLYQGDKASPAECELVGFVRVTGIPPAPKGDLRIAVTLALSERGELTVRAKDANSNRELSARLEEPRPVKGA